MDLFLERMIALTILIIINVIGVVTSGILIAVLLRNQKIPNIPGRAYLLSLAFATILLMILAAPSLLSVFVQDTYRFGVAVCEMSQFILTVSNSVTAFTITALSIEMYFIARKASHEIQDHYDETSQGRRQAVIVAAIWFLLVLLAIPALFESIVDVYFTDPQCYYSPMYLEKYSAGIGLSYVIVYYLLPVALILIFAVLTSGRLWCCKPKITTSDEDREIFTEQLQKAKKAAGLTLFLGLLFIIYYFPQFVIDNFFFFPYYMQYVSLCFHFGFNSIAIIGVVLISKDLRGLCSNVFRCK